MQIICSIQNKRPKFVFFWKPSFLKKYSILFLVRYREGTDDKKKLAEIGKLFFEKSQVFYNFWIFFFLNKLNDDATSSGDTGTSTTTHANTID